MSELVTIKSLTQSYDKFRVLDGINLTIEKGRIVGLLGPNGCGKTTLIKIIAGLIRDYKGEVKIAGMLPGPETKAIISYLPEKTYLGDWQRIRNAIDIFKDFYADFDTAKSTELLERMRLEPNMRIRDMSKGMQEKLQLTLVMARNAKLYLLDEPLGGVDPAARDMILDTILQNYAEDASLFISTHLVHDVERVFDHVIMMGYGKIIINDSVDAVREKHGKSVDEIFREAFKC